MLPERQSTDIQYIEPAEVFAYWYNKYRTGFPCQRPPLKWLSRNSRLPYSTCQYYRSRMEAAFPDAYAVAHAGKNLKLSKKSDQKLTKSLRARVNTHEKTKIGFLPPSRPCVNLPNME